MAQKSGNKEFYWSTSRGKQKWHIYWSFYTRTSSSTWSHWTLTDGHGRMMQNWPKEKGIWFDSLELPTVAQGQCLRTTWYRYLFIMSFLVSREISSKSGEAATSFLSHHCYGISDFFAILDQQHWWGVRSSHLEVLLPSRHKEKKKTVMLSECVLGRRDKNGFPRTWTSLDFQGVL